MDKTYVHYSHSSMSVKTQAQMILNGGFTSQPKQLQENEFFVKKRKRRYKHFIQPKIQ